MTKIYSTPQNTSNLYNNKNVFAQFERSMVTATKSVVYNPEIKESKKRSTLLKVGIASLIITTALSLASRKFRINTIKILENIKAHNDDILNKAKDTLSSKDTPFFFRVKIGIVRLADKVYNSFINFLGNLDPLQKYLTSKVTNKVPFVNRINSKIRPFFSGTVKKAAIGNYVAAEKASIELQATLRNLGSKSPELSSLGDDLARAVKKTYKSNMFSFSKRVKDLDQTTIKSAEQYYKELEKMVSNPNFKKATDSLFSKTLPYEIATTNLARHNQKILKLKRAISFPEKEKIEVLNNLLKKLTRTQNADAKVIKKLEEAISAYQKSSNASTIEGVSKVLGEISSKVSKPELTPLIENAHHALKATRPRVLQQLTQKVEQAFKSGQLSKEEFSLITKQINKVQSKLNKAVNFETHNLAGRWLDISIGPTPLLETSSLAVPVGVLAHEIATSENRQERTSKAIKYVPAIVGGVGAWTLAATKGIFGFQATLLGLITGMIFNRLGTFVDDKYYSKGREFNTLNLLSSDQKENPNVKIFEV